MRTIVSQAMRGKDSSAALSSLYFRGFVWTVAPSQGLRQTAAGLGAVEVVRVRAPRSPPPTGWRSRSRIRASAISWVLYAGAALMHQVSGHCLHGGVSGPTSALISPVVLSSPVGLRVYRYSIGLPISVLRLLSGQGSTGQTSLLVPCVASSTGSHPAGSGSTGDDVLVGEESPRPSRLGAADMDDRRL